MLWFGEDISKNFGSQKEERAHQEAVWDSSLLKNEILALTRAQLTPSPCLISIICENVAIGVIKKKNKCVESVGLSLVFYSMTIQTRILSEVTRIQVQDTSFIPAGKLGWQLQHPGEPFSTPNQVKNHWVPSGGGHLTPSHLPLCPYYATLTHK